MSGSAKAGTIAERHACELRVLPEFAVRAPPKRAQENLFLLDKDLHGCRLLGSWPETGLEEDQRINGDLLEMDFWPRIAFRVARDSCVVCASPNFL
jgi:hypothetical protein